MPQPQDGLGVLVRSREPWLGVGSTSGASGLAASWAQELALGDNVGPATQQLLAALTHEVLPVPGQVLHALVVLREYDLERGQKTQLRLWPWVRVCGISYGMAVYPTSCPL